MPDLRRARELLVRFKGDSYVFGCGVLDRAGLLARRLGSRAAFIYGGQVEKYGHAARVRESLREAGVEVAGECRGAAPNAPREDVFRIAATLAELQPELVVSFGGGSTIDAVKAALVLWSLGGDLDSYFGTAMVSRALEGAGGRLCPHLAIQSVASSAAHLTKYSNVTEVVRAQKKLIVDEAIVPQLALFDYSVTTSCPTPLTIDGGLDGMSHCLEVLYNAAAKPSYPQVAEIAGESIRLILRYLPVAVVAPEHLEAREALGLATDLGGYAIMIGGTSGAHLTSFSLVDVVSHGRACGLLNPYFTVFYGPAIQEPLRLVAELFQEAGYLPAETSNSSGRALAEAVAGAMLEFERSLGVPATLEQLPGFSDAHIQKILQAAKDPQLRMKLENMPVPLTPEMVDEYLGSVLWAAKTGDLGLIRNVD